MPVLSKSKFVRSPVERVFEFLTDVERHVEWSGELSFGLERITKTTDGPLAVGSKFRSLGKMSHRAGVEDNSTVTELELNRRFAWVTVSDGAGQQNTFQWAYTLQSIGDATSTRITYTLLERRFDPKPPQMWFPPTLWLIDRKVFGREMEAALNRIKEALERAPSG